MCVHVSIMHAAAYCLVVSHAGFDCQHMRHYAGHADKDACMSGDMFQMRAKTAAAPDRRRKLRQHVERLLQHLRLIQRHHQLEHLQDPDAGCYTNG